MIDAMVTGGITAGIGLRASATVEDLQVLLYLSDRLPDRIAMLADKACHPALQDIISRTGLPLVTYPRDAIRGIATPGQSARQMTIFGTGSVSEACALLAAGPQSRLLGPRIFAPSGRATIAFAIAPNTKGSTTQGET